MSRSAKLMIRSRWRQSSETASNMGCPRLDHGPARAGERPGRDRTPLDGSRAFRCVRARRQRLEDDGGGDEVLVQVEVGDGEEGARHQERVDGELRHLGVVGQISMLGMPPPPLPDTLEVQERVEEKGQVQPESEEPVLAEDLEVEAVNVADSDEEPGVIPLPYLAMVEGAEPGPGE